MSEEGQSIRVVGYGADSADYYFRGQRCYDQIQQDAIPKWFFYTALELRNCIERLLFEYLVLFGREELTKQQEKAYRATLLKDHILSIEPDFKLKLEFTGVMHQALSGVGVYIIDLDQLSELYGRLGNFLHAPKRPERTVENPRWWGRLNETLQQTFGVLDQVYSNVIGSVTFTEEGQDLYERWKSGSITDTQAQEDFLDGISGATS